MRTRFALFAVMLLGLAIVTDHQWGGIGRAIGPRCTVGVTGSAAKISVQGWTVPSTCQQLRTRLGGVAFASPDQPGEPAICSYLLDQDLVVVRDEGALKLIGNGACLLLRRQVETRALERPSP